jgi:hypothetical protein
VIVIFGPQHFFVQEQAMADGQPQIDPLAAGIAFLRRQDTIYSRNAWVNRWCGWLCGWGAAASAAFAAVSGKLFADHPSYPVWSGFLATLLVGITQTVKPDVLADAYYRGHLLIEMALGDYVLGKATAEDLISAWHLAQGGLPGAIPTKPKAGLPTA